MRSFDDFYSLRFQLIYDFLNDLAAAMVGLFGSGADTEMNTLYADLGQPFQFFLHSEVCGRELITAIAVHKCSQLHILSGILCKVPGPAVPCGQAGSSRADLARFQAGQECYSLHFLSFLLR